MKQILRMLIVLSVMILCLFGGAAKVSADDTDYGEEAYALLEIISTEFQYRNSDATKFPDQTKKKATLAWLDQKMAEYGYSVSRSFDFPAMAQDGKVFQHSISHSYVKKGTSKKKIVIGAHYDCANTAGCEDNGTGLAVVLELAKRFQNTETALTLEFCFWDAEEWLGSQGSYSYLEKGYADVLLYINIDCVGSGDKLFVYGGEYEANVLKRAWGYNMAMTTAKNLGIELNEMPLGINYYAPPTRTGASDQQHFANKKIPYIYFEANAWVDEDGVCPNQEKPYRYNTTSPAIKAQNATDMDGQIIHTAYDNFALLNSLFPGRLKQHMAETSQIISEMIRNMAESSAETYENYYQGIIFRE